MRIRPDDSNYTNLVVTAKVKPGTTGASPTPVNVVFGATGIANATSEAVFTSGFEALQPTNDTPDSDGYITYPIIGFRCLGRGKYGNKLRVRFAPALQSDKDNGFKNYRLEVYDSETSLTLCETFTASLFHEAVHNNNTIFFEDVVNDPENGSTKIQM